ncbi:hypothetical protein OOJ91_33845 [Micromonospora lupini]|uniref:hypothetical protein n=1 Tax=Micromonospora lupini TaxID=285679 RepID=UPI002252C59A|nr:hypothetical protein [Micromonospora lupini]MCX5070831.1 hypothetical protein [Micromonospora lupini]
MAGWDSVPWMVGGGAQHSAEVARVLAYVACRGNEGVVAAGDLTVRALAVPGGSVTVSPGACSILCRATGQMHQAYTGRNTTDDPVPIPATTSSGGRSDLIIARVEDPWLAGEPWPDPTDPTVGPYIRSVRVPGVPAGTTTLAQLGLGYTGIELARIDIPPSTGTFTQAMIKDLRKIANPRRERRVVVSSPAANDDVTSTTVWKDWPGVAVKSVAVPSWATQVKMTTHVGGALIYNDKTDGYLRNRIGAATFGQETRFDTNSAVAGNGIDRTLMTADELAIPASLRGTSVPIALQAILSLRGSSGTGLLRGYQGTTVVSDLEFVEVPE